MVRYLVRYSVMSHTRRIYNKIQVRTGMWGELSFHPYKQLPMKCHCSFCKGRRKKLDTKRIRCNNKAELRQQNKLELNFDENKFNEDLFLSLRDPFYYLVPLWDHYLDFLNPCYIDDYWD